jgi:signal peptide peptidase SppA
MTSFDLKAWRTLVPLERVRNPAPVVGVLRLDGNIGRAHRFGAGLSLQTLAERIYRVFSLRNLKAVALAVNSPGGSPVQSAMIAKRIRALAAEKEVPVYAFAEDVAASGGYILLAAADTLYADPSSIIGSIGVVSSGFGFTDLIDKLGVERRLHTAGEKKSMLDPFLPEKEDERVRLRAIQDEMHNTFKGYVRERRQGKLESGGDDLFTGEYWTGTRAEELGLVDGLGDLRTVMREKFGDRVKLKLVGPRRRRLRSLLNPLSPSSAIGAETWADELIDAIERRAAWARFGL